jgi:hypothetical protein
MHGHEGPDTSAFSFAAKQTFVGRDFGDEDGGVFAVEIG